MQEELGDVFVRWAGRGLSVCGILVTLSSAWTFLPTPVREDLKESVAQELKVMIPAAGRRERRLVAELTLLKDPTGGASVGWAQVWGLTG